MSELNETPQAEVVDTGEEAAPKIAPATEVAAPTPAPAVATAPGPQMGTEPAPQAPAPEAPPDNVAMAIESLPPEQRAELKTQHDMAFAQDLSSGKIAPETYHSLYEKKDTLGKIGTIFGLMLSGAGSGLAHQQNALLAMMDKQIANDLEAQKENQSNKQNWYRLSLEHERNLPENAAKWAAARSTMAKADFDEFANRQAGIEESAATSQAKNASSLASLQEVQNTIARMPPGAKRDAAQFQYDNVLVPAALTEIRQRNLDTAKKKELLGASNPMPVKSNPPPKGTARPGERYDAYNQSEFARRSALGRVLGDRAGASKDAIPVSAQHEIGAQAADLTANRNTYADSVESFHKLANMEMAGQAPGASIVSAGATALTELLHGKSSTAAGAADSLKDVFTAERKTQMEALIGKIARGNISETKAKELVESWMPAFYDTPKQREEKFEQLKKHFTSMKEEEAPELKKFGLYYPAPKYTFKGKPTELPKPSVESKPEKAPGMGKNKT